jgi:hypothetical protein
MSGTGARRPTLVTVVAVLVAVAGAVVLAAGIALIVGRDNELVQIPLLLARVDGSLPFDDDQDLSVYVVVIGAVVAVSGAILGLLALGVARGRASAYALVVVVVGALAAGAVLPRARSTDDLARLSVTALGGALALLLLLVLVLLVGRRSRAWVLGRSRLA